MIDVILQPISAAHVAELVDAADSKSAIRKGVKVRFLSWAPKSQSKNESESDLKVLTFFFALILFLILKKIKISNLPHSRKLSAQKVRAKMKARAIIKL